MKQRKFKIKFYTGTWIGDDIDVTPTIKFVTDSKINDDETIKVQLNYIGLCWLKWAIIFQYSTITYLNE